MMRLDELTPSASLLETERCHSDKFYARPFRPLDSDELDHDSQKVLTRTDLSGRNRLLLVSQMRSGNAQYDTEQQASHRTMLECLKGQQFASEETGSVDQYAHMSLFELCNDGKACPNKRMEAALTFPVDSMEIARLSHYDTFESHGEDEMEAAVKDAIRNFGGELLRPPVFYSCKVKALDVHPVIVPNSESVGFVRIDEGFDHSADEPEADRGSSTDHKWAMGKFATSLLDEHKPVDIVMDEIDYLEGMVVSIKHDIGLFAPRNETEHATKIRHRQKYLIDYNKLPREIRDQILHELKNIPADEFSEQYSSDESHIYSYLRDHEGFMGLIKRLIETDSDKVDLMTSIYYAVREPVQSNDQRS